MASTEEGICRDDTDCSEKQYCYRVSESCVDYTQCSRYNRQENRETRSRHPSQCGPCLFGYTAEELGTGEMAWFCKKANMQQNVPDVGKSNSTTIICITVGGVLLVCSLVVLIGVYLRKRVLKQRGNKPEQCGDLCTMEPSAPPVESSPFIGYGEELSQKPINNNKNLKDKNNLVRAAGFKPPSWIRTNPNYEHNLNNDNMTGMLGQLQSVSEIPPADDQSNAWPPEQLTIEVANGNLVQYQMEQIDNTNTILETNNPSSSTTNEEEGTNDNGSNNNNNNNNGATPGTNTEGSRERLRGSSNILISQKISMNLNLLND